MPNYLLTFLTSLQTYRAAALLRKCSHGFRDLGKGFICVQQCMKRCVSSEKQLFCLSERRQVTKTTVRIRWKMAPSLGSFNTHLFWLFCRNNLLIFSKLWVQLSELFHRRSQLTAGLQKVVASFTIQNLITVSVHWPLPPEWKVMSFCEPYCCLPR